MRKRNRIIVMLLCMVLLLSGCNLRTVDQLYCLPKRTDTETDLQAVIDRAMADLEYSAPVSGVNRQVTQKVDLDGDGVEECVVFAEDDSDKPLKILIFCQLASGYVLMDTIEGYGFAFDSVDFVQLDAQPGMEIVVSRQVSNDVLRSVSVYRFASARSRQLLNASCIKMVAADMDGDGIGELMLLTEGESEEGSGQLSLYEMSGGKLERVSAVPLSQQAGHIKRAQLGRLLDGTAAVFISGLADSDLLENEVYILEEGTFKNILTSQSVSSLSGYPLYPEDLNADGVLELPSLIPMSAHPEQQRQQYFVRWYALDRLGLQKDAAMTYMNHTQGWYLTMDADQVKKMTVVTDQDTCVFYGLEDGQTPVPLLTIHAVTDPAQDPPQGDYTVLHKGESANYYAVLEEAAARYGFTAENLKEHFSILRMERSTDEN